MAASGGSDNSQKTSTLARPRSLDEPSSVGEVGDEIMGDFDV